jgi:Na+/H+ antiporter NhaD/arsenite permease-like protein
LQKASPHRLAYFWLSGILSGFLDNAPTYLMFFGFAGGDARELMGSLVGTLAAISLGASAMGALTYVGNAPNPMIYAWRWSAESRCQASSLSWHGPARYCCRRLPSSDGCISGGL